MSGFITEWTVTADDLTITLPFTNNGTFDAEVDWGDSSTSDITAYNDADREHTFPSEGVYEVEITGSAPGWSFNNSSEGAKCTDIINWGDSADFDGFVYLQAGFSGSAITSLGTGKIQDDGITSLYGCFYNCTSLSGTIPSDLFDNCTSVTRLDLLFRNCSSLTGSVPDFSSCTAAQRFSEAFRDCSGLNGTIPSTTFNNLSNATRFDSVFRGCSSLTGSVPDFSDCTSAELFNNTFLSCSGLNGTIPSTTFSGLSSVTSFYGVFNGCSSLTGSVPDFSDCTSVTDFRQAFNDCSSLNGTIPSDAFDGLSNVTRFDSMFYDCSSLTGSTPDLSDCTSAVNFSSMFRNCNSIKITADLFYADGDQDTRFLNQSVNFASCFSRSGGASDGTAPDLWNCDFGTGSPEDYNCFGGSGNSETTLDNYKAIPTDWGGSSVGDPNITDINTDEEIEVGETGAVATGTDFIYEDATLELGDSDTYAGSSTLVEQTITDMSDNSITFNVSQGGLSLGTVYAYVTTQRGQRNSSGFSVTLNESTTEEHNAGLFGCAF